MDDLQELPTDWTTCLAIVAHPDDMEYGASAAVAAWTAAGKSVAYLLVTRGEAGIDGIEPGAVAPLRGEEQRQACDIVGVEELEFLDYPDGMIEYGLPLRHDLDRPSNGMNLVPSHRGDVARVELHRVVVGRRDVEPELRHRAAGAGIVAGPTAGRRKTSSGTLRGCRNRRDTEAAVKVL